MKFENTLENLAVLILNYNSSSLTISNADNMLQFGKGLNVVIVDNCSTDDSVAKFESHFKDAKNVFICKNNSNSGYAAGNNCGIKFIREHLPYADAILITNPDIFVPCTEVLESMYSEIFNNKKIGAVTVQTIYNGRIREPNECAWRHHSVSRLLMMSSVLFGRKVTHARYKEFDIQEREYSVVDVVQGCFFMCRVDALLDINGFDENTFLYAEEQILAKRFNRKGYYNAVLPKYFIYHNHREKDKQLKNYATKVEDMRHYFDSEKYYIREYMNCSKWKKFLARYVLDIDFQIKKLLLHLRWRIQGSI